MPVKPLDAQSACSCRRDCSRASRHPKMLKSRFPSADDLLRKGPIPIAGTSQALPVNATFLRALMCQATFQAHVSRSSNRSRANFRVTRDSPGTASPLWTLFELLLRKKRSVRTELTSFRATRSGLGRWVHRRWAGRLGYISNIRRPQGPNYDKALATGRQWRIGFIKVDYDVGRTLRRQPQ